MASEEQLPVSAKIEISAKAEVKAEIPSSSMGRLVDSLTDAIRPFTEGRGFRADQIRLQREDVLLEIAHKAKRRSEVENITLTGVPNKFLIPFLEVASREDAGDQIVALWSNLLLKASSSFEGIYVTYVDILGRISSKEAILLASMCDEALMGMGRSFRQIQNSLNYGPSIVAYVHEKFKPVVGSQAKQNSLEILNALKFQSGRAIMMVCPAIVEGKSETGETVSLGVGSTMTAYTQEFYDDQSSFDILEREGLLSFNRLTFDVNGGVATVDWVELTPLGINFLEACEGKQSV